MNEVTSILNAIENGDRLASDRLLPLVYEELRRLANSRLSNEPSGQTLQATALVHEAFLRLVERQDQRCWNSKGHFFAAAAIAMRRILVDNARRKLSQKRGGNHKRIGVQNLDFADPSDPGLLTELNSCLERLAGLAPAVAEVVNLRFFAGLTIEQVSSALSISVRTANRHWAFAKAWLYSEMSDSQLPR